MAEHEVHEVRGPVARGLLTLLVLEEGRPVTPARLVSSLWDDPPEAARRNTASHVTELRRQLATCLPEAAERLRTVSGPEGTSYRLDVEPDELDATLLRDLVVRGTTALRAGNAGQAVEPLERAVALWGGPLGWECAVSTELRRRFDAFDDLYATARERLVEARLALGGNTELVPEIHAILARDPLRESAWGLLVRALRGRGEAAGTFAAHTRPIPGPTAPGDAAGGRAAHGGGVFIPRARLSPEGPTHRIPQPRKH
ncbi:BTAD domain-containing putative transcriptional regulator [Streptomyces sp. ST2-7A]|uniref:AfsR/SARP family transcriptional regulator n=1 Tax=Streptomyces sp. ST2-7A TaxID=2907214 RepID=UPI001F233E06|nr:BTAD domain-containing putative transcriptional regulator [Streptomyces sp. ST2-7A]MCE7080497.1 winged helix-turn-helix domain-containing protein [Streptomyces sp. ST2-7A]